MIICEIGLNHMGNTKYANEYIEKIIKTNADGILFHISEKNHFMKKTQNYCYQINSTSMPSKK